MTHARPTVLCYLQTTNDDATHNQLSYLAQAKVSIKANSGRVGASTRAGKFLAAVMTKAAKLVCVSQAKAEKGGGEGLLQYYCLVWWCK